MAASAASSPARCTAPAGLRVREPLAPAPAGTFGPDAEGRGLWPCKAEGESARGALTRPGATAR